MRSMTLSIFAAFLAVSTVSLFMTPTRAAAQKEALIYSFLDNNRDGSSPPAAPIFDAAGNLYGMTSFGGAHNYGAVFELSPKVGGGWREQILHSFSNTGKDGYNPYAGLVLDAAGNLYGTTAYGGAHNGGIVFELSPLPSGVWNEKILHNFTPGTTDGYDPQAGLVIDTAGNLFGTTVLGGIYGGGTAFELTASGGAWSEKLLHPFSAKGAGGDNPRSTLILDSAGNLYGTAEGGGSSHSGTAFELTPASKGPWTETVLHTFGTAATDGVNPQAGLIFDAAGNLYGTTTSGGASTYGTVFELTPAAGGTWIETVLYSFLANGIDGYYPTAGLILDAVGNLYGTTDNGGAFYGTVFQLSPSASGSWTETQLYVFNLNGGDGTYPFGGLVFDATGNLYGATSTGGPYNEGVVFEITP